MHRRDYHFDSTRSCRFLFSYSIEHHAYTTWLVTSLWFAFLGVLFLIRTNMTGNFRLYCWILIIHPSSKKSAWYISQEFQFFACMASCLGSEDVLDLVPDELSVRNIYLWVILQRHSKMPRQSMIHLWSFHCWLDGNFNIWLSQKFYSDMLLSESVFNLSWSALRTTWWLEDSPDLTTSQSQRKICS